MATPTAAAAGAAATAATDDALAPLSAPTGAASTASGFVITEPSDKEWLKALPRATQEKYQSAFERLEENEYDTDAWSTIVMDAEQRALEIARRLFERFLRVFPTSSRHWVIYIKLLIQHKDYEHVEELFKRCLFKCPTVELYTEYLQYIRMRRGRSRDDWRAILNAFMFATEHVGLDIGAAQIWHEYLKFLMDDSLPSPFSAEESHENIMRVFFEALGVPMHNSEIINTLFEQYCSSANQPPPDRFRRQYSFTRSVFRERKQFYDGIIRSMLATPPRSDHKQQSQLALWRKLIDFERRSSHRLPPKTLARRVRFTYYQCLMCFYHFSEVWYEFAMFMQARDAKDSTDDSAGKILKQAIEAVPRSPLIVIALAENEEARGDVAAATKVYDAGLTASDDPLVPIHYMRFVLRAQGAQAFRKLFISRILKLNEVSPHVYVANARLEYSVNHNAKFAQNVFELGMKKFGANPDFVLQYAEFLISQHDETNVRALFERALQEIPPENAQRIMHRYLMFENETSRIENVLKLQARMVAAYPQEYSDSGIALNLERFRFNDLLPCSVETYQKHVKNARVDNLIASSDAALKASQLPIEVHGALASLIASIDGLTAAPNGPNPDIDALVNAIQSVSIPSKVMDEVTKEFEAASSKKTKSVALDSDSDDEKDDAEANDIYRRRQREKIRKMGDLDT